MYAASACLVLVLVVMGVSLLNSFDRMQSVQNTLDTLAGATDTVETSGTVTAVTPEDGAGDGQDSEADAQPDDSQNTSDDAQTGSGDSADASEADAEQTANGQAADIQSADAQSEDAQSSDEGSSGDIIVTEGNGSDGVYTVEEGDTLAIISRKMYGDVTHVDAICRMNGITDGNLIYVGQKLLLP